MDHTPMTGDELSDLTKYRPEQEPQPLSTDEQFQQYEAPPSSVGELGEELDLFIKTVKSSPSEDNQKSLLLTAYQLADLTGQNETYKLLFHALDIPHALQSRVLGNYRTRKLERTVASKTRNVHLVTEEATKLNEDGHPDKAKRLMNSMKYTDPNGPRPYNIGTDYWRELEAQPPEFTIGIQALDDVAKIPSAALTIIAARPGNGKTTLALNLFSRATKKGAAAFYSYEQTAMDITTRLITIESGVGFHGDEDKRNAAWGELAERTREGRLFLFDTPHNIDGLCSDIRRLHHSLQGGLRVVVIDYLQKVRPAEQKQGYEGIKEVCSKLLSLALELKIPVVACAQFSRAAEKDEDDGVFRPFLSWLREGGDIEQDAALIIGMRKKDGQLEAHIMKNRNGTAGETAVVQIDWSTQRVEE